MSYSRYSAAGRPAGLKRTTCALAAGLALTMALAGCAADRYSMSGPRLAAARPDRAPKPRRIPRLTTGEYLRSWGLQAVGANVAYKAGATGRGVTIALVDTGLPADDADLVLSKASIDLIERRKPETPEQIRHSRLVAGPLASILNGRGTLGMAYDATLLSIRADIDGACATECAFRTADVARGIDYAIGQGARVLVLAMVSPTPNKPMSRTLEDAVGRAVDAGLVVVIAGGNSGSSEPAWPARYAANPRFGGQVIAVGASTYAGDLAEWSDRAGVTHDSYIAAPGAQIITDCGSKTCAVVSGTSFSAPYVAGAAALLMDAYPTLSGRDVAQLLLRHAKDLGAPGADPIYGRGLLDVGAAFAAARVMAQAPGAVG